jgi:hypothetical protein
VALDVVHCLLDAIERHRPLLQRAHQARGQLGAVEVLSAPVALDDGQARTLGPLVRREPMGASLALSPAANGASGLEVSRVDDPRSALVASWTAQAVSPCGLHKRWYREAPYHNM